MKLDKKRTVFYFSFATALACSAYLVYRLSTSGQTAGLTADLATCSLFLGLALIVIFVNQRNRDNEIDRAFDAAVRLSKGMNLELEPGSELEFALQEASDYMAEKAALAQKISFGKIPKNFEARSEEDHFGKSFFEMIRTLNEKYSTETLLDDIAREKKALIDAIQNAVDGDLLAEADISGAHTGEIAAAVNLLIQKYSRFVESVKNILVDLSASAISSDESLQQIISAGTAENQQLSRTASAADDLAREVQELAREQKRAAELSSDLRGKMRRGAHTTDESIQAMLRVRNRSQEISKRIKKLAERTQKIGQLSLDLETLVDQIQLVSLNASLRSSKEFQNEFSPVANEVQKISERSSRLSNELSQSARSLNSETQELVTTMEETTQEIINGSELAERLAQSLVELQRLTAELADISESNDSAAQLSLKSTRDSVAAIKSIQEVSRLIENTSRRLADSIRTISTLTSRLQTESSRMRTSLHSANSNLFKESSIFVN
ncbi:MAG TPA: methyl-accepting chemotaxis protein [Pyrinomonadaceae bacterium]|nr:methyl-accepting chemotaxis protein [Pyrinomonadaceae bacterium]